MTNSQGKQVAIWTIIAAIVAIGGFFLLTTPDDRTFGEKANDAVESLDEGVDDAAREFEDRTPAERIGDEIEDATDGDRN